MVLGGLHHLAHALGVADVAGVDPQAGRARLGRLDGALVVEMDVGHDRHRAFRARSRAAPRVLSSSGVETRTISAPATAQRWICSIVAATSVVSVLVIVCTEIGASPPTSTLPTRICRDSRRSMLRQGRIGLCVIGQASQVQGHTPR